MEGTVSVTLAHPTNGSAPMHVEHHRLPGFVGFVPQEDILDRLLTVRELLTFHALTRYPGAQPGPEIDAMVEDVLADLAIRHVADQVIGGGENMAANISGGQLKRVNIACELVAVKRPALLLLDEPTAGLDAAIAYDLMHALVGLRDKGITVVVVLQQPRAEVFELIDHLFLMNMMGEIVYEGRPQNAVSYLSTLGFTPSEETADADFCVDVLNGLVRSSHAVSYDELPTLWRNRPDQGKQDLEVAAAVPAKEETTVMLSVSKPTALRSSQIHAFCNQFCLNAHRLLLTRFRNRGSIITYLAISFLMAVSLSSGFSILLQDSYLNVLIPPVERGLNEFYPSPLEKYKDDNVNSLGFTQLLFFMSSALGSAACLAAVPVFAGQRPLIAREAASGLSVIAYGAGRIVADMVFVLASAFVFVGVWVCFGHAGSYAHWIAVILATAFASSAIGYVAGAVAPDNNASVFAIIISFIFCVFSGTDPTLHSVRDLPVVNWLWYLSYATYTAEATYYTWAQYLTNGGRVDVDLQSGADHYGYRIDQGLGPSIGALVGLGIAMRIVAVYFLWNHARK